jgi:hypothetical protein
MKHLDMRLLEQAAAAAVYKPARWNDDQTALLMLDDDGQALRLAVRLNLHVWVSNPLTYAGLDGNLRTAEGHIEHGCAAKATRRAIVKAAARMAPSHG